MKFCPNCKKEFEGRLNKIYCSDKCRDHQKFIRTKNNVIKYDKFRTRQKGYDKKYYCNSGKENKLKYHKGKRFRDYQNKWRRDKKYWLEQYEKNPQLNRAKAKRNRKTLKGKLNTLKCNQRRRKKDRKRHV